MIGEDQTRRRFCDDPSSSPRSNRGDIVVWAEVEEMPRGRPVASDMFGCGSAQDWCHAAAWASSSPDFEAIGAGRLSSGDDHGREDQWFLRGTLECFWPFAPLFSPAIVENDSGHPPFSDALIAATLRMDTPGLSSARSLAKPGQYMMTAPYASFLPS